MTALCLLSVYRLFSCLSLRGGEFACSTSGGGEHCSCRQSTRIVVFYLVVWHSIWWCLVLYFFWPSIYRDSNAVYAAVAILVCRKQFDLVLGDFHQTTASWKEWEQWCCSLCLLSVVRGETIPVASTAVIIILSQHEEEQVEQQWGSCFSFSLRLVSRTRVGVSYMLSVICGAGKAAGR